MYTLNSNEIYGIKNSFNYTPLIPSVLLHKATKISNSIAILFFVHSKCLHRFIFFEVLYM